MKQFKTLFVVMLGAMIYGVTLADESLDGGWESNKGERIDILDGFKPNTGPVITYKKGKVSGITTWRIDPSSKELKIQYSSTVLYCILDYTADMQNFFRKFKIAPTT